MATSGPNSGSSFANVDRGASYDAWANVTNAASSNNTDATYTATDENSESDYLVAKGFGFSIPTGSTIDGILAEVEAQGPGTDDFSDISVLLTKDGSTGASSDYANYVSIPTTDTYMSYGGAADLWGTTWTVAEINSANFGLMYAGYKFGASLGEILSVDHIRITVYYTPVAGGGIPRGAFCKPFRGPFAGSIGW